tara:strand:- start:899 stop:1240 length:342 start_codon:yes stop_codon:yes gene_type:complete
MEPQITKWFPSLTRVRGNKSYDHIDENGVKYDAKNFTKNGLQFAPSSQIGAGRKFNESLAHQKAKVMVYICCDIVDFPKIRVKFAKGSDLIKSYPNCKISLTKRKEFFHDKSC